MDLMALTLKTSLVLGLGMLAEWAVRRRSAAVRHWILALTVFCAAVVPVIGGLTPSWRMRAFPVSTSERPPATDVDVSFSPVAPPAIARRAPVQHADEGWSVIRAQVRWIWLSGVAVNLWLLVIGLFRLRHLGSVFSPSSLRLQSVSSMSRRYSA